MKLTSLVPWSLAPVAAFGTATVVGFARWERRTRALRARLEAAREPVRPARVDLSELGGLPAPVQRYLRLVLRDGQPLVAGARVRHTGTFNASATGTRWLPFTSEQWVITRRPGFVWNARVAMVPGLPVRVHDAYVAGEGVLHASVLGLVPVAEGRGAGLAEGELMRYLAEAVWYPTALLPGQGVRWDAVDDRTAVGTLTDEGVRVSLRFTFTEQGLLEAVDARARGRSVEGRIVPTPWRGRFWDYETRYGMLVPLEGEVAWRPPEGEKPYWRGRIVELDVQFVPGDRAV